ncbi:GspH/FimT family pseudopilin [Pseudoalteromonas sp. SSDWG2]|uniref:GspH/FimT family pseudopilin n=1 Tax=Pseudoalteromonas sp. SSDWG2 TaxID=3139391 RepID=UPI003BAB4452
MKSFEQSRNKGFTLIELMMTIAIAAILLAIALYDTSQMTAKEKANNFSGEFKRQLKFARAKAMTTGDPVIVCPVTTPGSTGACGNDWQAGTIVMFSDINNNGSFDADADILVRALSPLTANSKLINTSGESSIRFDQRGQTATTQSFIYCPSTSDNKYNISVDVSPSGAVRDKGSTTSTCGT